MTKIFLLLSLLSLVAGCASLEYAASNAAKNGDHAGAAKLYIRYAEEKEKDSNTTSLAGIYYCQAASEFLKAGGAENIQSAIAAAEKGIARRQDFAEQFAKMADRDRAIEDPMGYESLLSHTKYLFVCKLTLAKARLSNGDHEGVIALVKGYTDLDSVRARFVLDHKFDGSKFQYTNSDYDGFGVNFVDFLRSHDSRLADAVENHYRSSSLAVAEQQKQDEAIRQARKAEDARLESIKREQAALEAEAKRERARREAQARVEYERQHPEIAYAREVEAAAQNQCAQCKSRCDDQALPCTAACFGNLADTMCIARCQVALDTCKTGCDERRDALIVKAGSAPPSSVRSTCDVLAEDREIETMEKRLPTEMKGLGKKKRECYAAKQYVKIAHYRIRAAARCNLDPAEPKRYLQDVEVQEREFCQGLSMK